MPSLFTGVTTVDKLPREKWRHMDTCRHTHIFSDGLPWNNKMSLSLSLSFSIHNNSSEDLELKIRGQEKECV